MTGSPRAHARGESLTTITIEQIRALVVRGKTGLGRPYPDGARRAVLAFIAQRERQGIGLVTVAEEIGVSATTLREWEQAKPAVAQTSRAEFCEVEIITARSASSAPVIHGPGGLRIEGVTVADIAELVRAISARSNDGVEQQ